MNRRLIFQITIIIALCFLCLCVAVMGHIVLVKFLENHTGVKIRRAESTAETLKDLLYLFICSVLPLIVICTWKLIPVYSFRKRLLSILMILVCISAAVGLRIAMLTRTAQLRHRTLIKTEAGSFRLPGPFIFSQEINLWLYIATAVSVAIGLIFILLRDHREQKIEFSFEEKQTA